MYDRHFLFYWGKGIFDFKSRNTECSRTILLWSLFPSTGPRTFSRPVVSCSIWGKIKLDVRFRKFSAPENMDPLRKIKTAVLWWLIGIDLNADDDVIEWSLLQPAVQRGALRSFDWMGNLTHPYPIMLCASQIPHGLSWGLVETRSSSLIYSNSDRN